jgi:hypothetical protein
MEESSKEANPCLSYGDHVQSRIWSLDANLIELLKHGVARDLAPDGPNHHLVLRDAKCWSTHHGGEGSLGVLTAHNIKS